MARSPGERSSLLADLWIILLGSWGFLQQCLKSWTRTAKKPHEFESGK
jgi:hypothetical protein